MMSFDIRLKRLSDSADSIIPKIKRGIEKESLRITADGHLSQSAHPQALGATLTHPYITTDYSEALLELVTPTYFSVTEMLRHLEQLHQIIYHHIADEMLWVNSLPCLLSSEDSIPIAQFGTSNIGKMKHVYRRGLGLRYGRKMQVIAGIHYNFSVPDDFWQVLDILHSESDHTAISNAYMAGTRNFHRYCWILFYLFGASPAACRSFFDDNDPGNLQTIQSHTLYGEYATSIRMSNFGYRNPVQSEIRIDHNSVDGYIETLTNVINTPFPKYEQFGVKSNGDYLQLNANLLQIENEYYSVIRPKRRTRPLEKPTAALRDRGVEYLEVRCLDLDPFNAIGISENQARFMDLFLMFCLINPAPRLSDRHPEIISSNKDAIVLEGRSPQLRLIRNGKSVSPREWGLELLLKLEDVATVFDHALGGDLYRQAVLEQRTKLEDPEQTPSARIVRSLLKENEPFFSFAMRMAKKAKQTITKNPLDPEEIERYRAIASESIDRQRELEATNDTDFDSFLSRYFAQ